MGEGMMPAWICNVCGERWPKKRDGEKPPLECAKCRTTRWNTGDKYVRQGERRVAAEPCAIAARASEVRERIESGLAGIDRYARPRHDTKTCRNYGCGLCAVERGKRSS